MSDVETTPGTLATVIARRPRCSVIEGICWTLTILGAVAAFVQAVEVFVSAESAPQQSL